MGSITDLSKPYGFYGISHDAEPDDLQALGIAKSALCNTGIYVDCVIGNPDITHAPGQSKEHEMQARQTRTNDIFKDNVAHAGATHNREVSESYLKEILNQSTDKNCLILHTSSFKSLEEIFKRSQKGQLKNVTILSYGSVNLTWAMPEKAVEKDYTNFYESLKNSGATLVQVEAFPLLDTKNKLTHKNTPVAYSLLQQIDAPAGQEWLNFVEEAAEKVRAKQATKVAEYIVNGINQAPEDQKDHLIESVSKLLEALNAPCDSTPLSEITKENLQAKLNQSFVGSGHDRLAVELGQVKTHLLSILKDLNPDELKRPFNIYEATSLKGQVLIADQIPAILFSELVENRKNGLINECLAVEFSKLNGRFPVYSVTSLQSHLFYMDTKQKVAQLGITQTKEERIASYLKYIDLCMSMGILANSGFISEPKREELLRSGSLSNLKVLAEQVKGLGYDLPAAYTALKI